MIDCMPRFPLPNRPVGRPDTGRGARALALTRGAADPEEAMAARGYLHSGTRTVPLARNRTGAPFAIRYCDGAIRVSRRALRETKIRRSVRRSSKHSERCPRARSRRVPPRDDYSQVTGPSDGPGRPPRGCGHDGRAVTAPAAPEPRQPGVAPGRCRANRRTRSRRKVGRTRRVLLTTPPAAADPRPMPHVTATTQVKSHLRAGRSRCGRPGGGAHGRHEGPDRPRLSTTLRPGRIGAGPACRSVTGRYRSRRPAPARDRHLPSIAG